MTEPLEYPTFCDLGRPIDVLMHSWSLGWSDDPALREHGWAHTELLEYAVEEPERAWKCILYALDDPACGPHLGLLAAGPLEDLLSLHGPAFIDRAEALAQTHPHFAAVLSGVWQFQMSDEIWERVQKVAVSV